MDQVQQKETAGGAGTCPRCGAALSAGALGGLCPACLLKQGAASDSGVPPHATPFEPPGVTEIARLFPQLELTELIGRGGMGAVYKARQPALDRLVALKVLPMRPGAPADFAERFTREARALARLNHPNIVAVYEFGQVEGLHYFIMEYVDGTTLRQMERAGRLSPRAALQIVPALCDALQYAHDEGVVHRDIKPENVLVDRRGRVTVADFGLARMLDPDSAALRLTGEGQVMGTPHYMAPEQVEHPLQVDHRADIYALGVVFYEMLTGELPLGRFPPPSARVRLDVRLDEVVLRALEKAPERRYQHASEVRTAVETIAPAPGDPALAAAAATKAASTCRGRWLTLVGLRDGQPVVRWPQVILVADILAIGVVLALYLAEQIPFAGYAIALGPTGMALAVLAVLLTVLPLLIQRALARPSAELPVLPGARRAPAAPPAAASAALDASGLRQVRWPAVGLFLTGVADWVLTPLLAALALPLMTGPAGSARFSPGLIAVALLVPFVFSGIVFVAALRMLRLQSYGWAIAAAIFCMLVTPGNIIGFPIGIWALAVLLRPDVRAAFDTGRPLPAPAPAPASAARGGGGTRVVLMVIGAVAVGASLLMVMLASLAITWALVVRRTAAEARRCEMALERAERDLHQAARRSATGGLPGMAPSQANATTPGGPGMPGRVPGMEDAPEPGDGTMPESLPGPAPELDEGADGLARLKARRAATDLAAAEADYAAGRIPNDAVLRARLAKAVAEAEVAGDAAGAARAKLQYTEEILRLIEAKFRAGLVPAGEVDKARSERDEAQNALSNRPPAERRTRRAEDTPE